MTINLTPFKHEPLCYGHTWTVEDESVLAQRIARVALGQARHIQKILAGASVVAPATTENAARDAIKLLTVAAGEDPWHRDGWMFQVLSWIAAYRAAPDSIISTPHIRLADKGFDGLELEINKKTGKVKGAIIFEDKATDNPRDTVRGAVWPEFAALESGERENMLTAEVVALLSTKPNIDPDAAIENIIWGNVRRYRVSITVGANHSDEAGRRRLFKGYDAIAAGDMKRRRAETLHVDDLRAWMQRLAEKAITIVRAEMTAHV